MSTALPVVNVPRLGDALKLAGLKMVHIKELCELQMKGNGLRAKVQAQVILIFSE